MTYRYINLLCIILIGSCHQNQESIDIQMPSVYEPPVSVALNLKEGYKINLVTGDSIPRLNNYKGDTISTGIPIQVKGIKTFPKSAAPPLSIVTNVPLEIPLQTDVRVNANSLVKIPIDLSALNRYKPIIDSLNSYVISVYGDTIPIGIPQMIKEVYQPFMQPNYKVAQAPRMRDYTSYNIQYLDVEQGMQSSMVKSIFEDKKGNIWLGTETGVSRYDGTSFRHYSGKETTQIQNSTRILEDSKENYWFCTQEAGIICLNKKGFFRINEQISTLYTPGINSVLEDRNGNIWFGTWNGVVLKYQPSTGDEGGRLFHYVLRENPQPGMVYDMEEDQMGNIWFCTSRDGVFQFDGNGFAQISEKEGLPSNGVWSVCEDKKGDLWFGTSKGACHFQTEEDGQKGTFTHFTTREGLSFNNTMTICEDSENNIWLGTWGGGVNKLKIIKAEEGHYISITQYTDKEGLSSNLVHDVYADRNANIWVATSGGGLNIIGNKSFEHYTELTGINNLMIRSLCEDKNGFLWFGTEGNGISNVVFTENGNPSKIQHYTSEDLFVIRWTCDIKEDSHGNLWFGSTQGMMRLESKQKNNKLTFLHFANSQGFTDAWVTCMIQDEKGNLWFGTYGGGLICGRISADGSIEQFTHFTEDQGFFCNYITDIAEDNKGNLWIESDINGISYFELDDNNEQGVLTVYSEREGLLSNHLSVFFLDKESNLWIGTQQSGICKFILPQNGKEGEFIVYTQKQGLSSNYVRSIFSPDENKESRIWVGTSNGLNLIQTNQSSESKPGIISFGTSDGLKRTDFTFRSAKSDSKGYVWWGTRKGLQRLNVNAFKPSASIPQPFLRQLDINEQYLGYHSISSSLQKEIRYGKVDPFENIPLEPSLSYKKNHLTFHFSATDWNTPTKIKYSYKIEGLDDNWSIPSEVTNADYRNLPSGTHTFKVSAIGESQIWSDPFEYTFTIRPPWWYAWWAFVMYGCLGGLVLYRTYRFQLDRKLEMAEKKRLVELDRVKNRLYTNITHEFRTPLTLIHGPVTQALTRNSVIEQKDVQSIHRQSERLQQLINQMLELQKLEAGMLRPHYAFGEIIQVLRYLFGSFETWAKEKNISMIFSSTLQEVYMDLDKEKLTQIISNLVSNAIKHTPRGGKIAMVLNTSPSGDFLLINVTDTGIGIHEEDLPYVFDRFYQSKKAAVGGTGIGLALVKNLTELLGGTITVESKLDVGSTFKLALPITKHAPKSLEPIVVSEHIQEMQDEETQFIPPVQATHGKPIVLIIEDHPEVSQYIVSCLSSEFTTMTTLNGNDGLHLAYEHIPDLIISDVMMPGKDGFELTRILKTDIQTSHIPIILLTGRGDHDAMIAGIEHGADAYVVKPFDPDELTLRVRKLLELRANLSQYYRQHASTDKPDINVQASARENEFLKKLRGFIEDHISDSQFNMIKLSQYMAMSHPQLHRKITALTGESAGKFVRSVRLGKAIELIKNSDMTISEIAYETGFSEPGYFTKVFSKEYGMSPSEYRASI